MKFMGQQWGQVYFCTAKINLTPFERDAGPCRGSRTPPSLIDVRDSVQVTQGAFEARVESIDTFADRSPVS